MVTKLSSTFEQICCLGNRYLGTEDNVPCVATNQQQSVEWKVTKTRDTPAEYITAELVAEVRELYEKKNNNKKQVWRDSGRAFTVCAIACAQTKLNSG